MSTWSITLSGGCRHRYDRRRARPTLSLRRSAAGRPRSQRVARRRDARAVPPRPGVGERELAGLLRGLQARRGAADPRSGSGAARRPPLPPSAPAEPRGGRRSRVGEPLRGAAARIVANMEASLQVPTATSFRSIPAKLLEVNRKVINGYLGRTRGGKVSFTHLIGYAVVRAIHETAPVMNSSYVTDADGKPRVVRHDHVSLGIAVDLEKRDGSRTLLVPVVARRRHLGLPWVLGRLRGAHPQGPRQQAQPRRLRRLHREPHEPGHDRHRAVGAPADAGPGPDRRCGQPRLPDGVAGGRPRHVGRAGRLEVDHDQLHLRPPHHPGRRVGPVPEAGGGAAARRRRVLRRGVPCPGRALRGRAVAARRPPDRPRAGDAREADGGGQPHPGAPGARPPDRRPRPAAVEGARHARRARPGHLRAHHLGPRPRVPHRRPGRPRADAPGRRPARAARRVLPHDRHRVHAHPGSRGAALDPGPGRGRRRRSSTSRTSATSSSASTRRRPSRSSWPRSTSGRSGSGSRGRSRPSRSSTPSSRPPPTPTSTAR